MTVMTVITAIRVNRNLWDGFQQATRKSDLVGGSLTIFGFQTSWWILWSSVWWSPTSNREQLWEHIYEDAGNIFFEIFKRA